MDKESRNRIQRATQSVRTLLENEYAEQLEGLFDIRLSGTIADKPGEHLNASQRVLRGKLVGAIKHQIATGMDTAASVGSYLREASFTTLNRFVALKMLEARQLVQECISRGEESRGFKEFTGLAPGLLQLPDRGYRIYIESLYDEIGREVRVLFDRRDPASLLWPRRQTLQKLLGVLNGAELEGIWEQDESIGWVYQYFNSDEERRQMRAESQVPRSSRELAVRNQFFTPRYVVQFLTDNTLGRIWYEMRQGDTELRDLECLVCRDNEVFLAEGEEPASDGSRAEDDLSAGEQLQEAVEIPFRPKKDPRDLRVLDPACGSGHFLLYAFELLLTIYEEAWADPESTAFAETGFTLSQDYPDLTSLRHEVPGLILRHNLHGIDIDPRCAQIAALALWMRAQRAFENSGVGRNERPAIEKTNIVVAEPMPGDPDLRQEFVASLEPKLGNLLEWVFERMELVGEAGPVLRIEDGIARAVRKFYGEHGELFRSSDEDRWEGAMGSLTSALKTYAERATNGRAFQRRLFSEDAARGLGFIGLCEEKYDAVLMNPPFGDCTSNARDYVKTSYSTAYADFGAVFVLRGLELLNEHGRLGTITNRTLLAAKGFSNWRAALLEDAGLHVLVDLGHGVLDAMVETAMYICGGSRGHEGKYESGFLGLLETKNKRKELLDRCGRSDAFEWRNPHEFNSVPGVPWAYWVPENLLRRFKTDSSFLKLGGLIFQGTATADDFRFFRLRWEVQHSSINPAPHRYDGDFQEHRWSPIAKGGEYSLWWDDIHLVMDWATNGKQIRSFVDSAGRLRSRPQNTDKFFRRGSTYPERTTSAFGLRFLPPGLSFSHVGWAIFAPQEWTDEEVLGTYNNRIARYFMEVLLGQGDSSASGTAARHHFRSDVGPIPWPRLPTINIRRHVAFLVDQAALNSFSETSQFFSGRRHFDNSATTWDSVIANWWERQCDGWLRIATSFAQVEEAIVDSYGLSDTELQEIERAEGRALTSFPEKEVTPGDVASLFRSSVEELTAQAKEVCGAKRYIVKKAFFVHRAVDLGCHIFGANPRSIVEAARAAGAKECGAEPEFAATLLSWILGIAIGHRNADAIVSEGPTCLDALPQSGYEETGDGISIWVDDFGHQLDIVAQLQQAANGYWSNGGEQIVDEAVTKVAKSKTLRDWFRNEFFAFHISAYSKSRRKAPIYWQLSIPSNAYSVWINYQQLTRDTFYKIGNEFVEPKLLHEDRRLSERRQEAGATPSARQRRDIDAQENLLEELRSFRDEVALVSPVWNPDLNDGVIINFAPLWRLVPQHRAWQKECKKVWEKLVDADYDWAHLAMHLWPERVVQKCAEDRSLAIAHGLDNIFWAEDADGKWHRRDVAPDELRALINQRTSPAVQEALKNLLEAPAPNASRANRKSASRVGITRTRASSERQDNLASNRRASRQSVSPVQEDLLGKVMAVIATNGSGSSKSDVIDATGITPGQWNKAIKTLLANGSVTQTGERRGARYHLAGADA